MVERKYRNEENTMKRNTLLMTAAFLFISVLPLQAKWWIFGKGKKEGVNISYMYLNKIPYTDFNGKAVFYSEAMDKNMVIVNGKIKSGNGSIGSVLISLDNKETWDKANLANDGTFEYYFKLEKDKIYDFALKAIDTTGASNDIAATAIKIQLSNEKIQDRVYPFLSKLFAAYEAKNKDNFMAMVSEAFIGKDILSSALSQDFFALSQIKFKWFLNSVSQRPDGSIFVSMRYERKVTVSSTGNPLKDTGFTELALKAEDEELKLLSMKSPLLFGVSATEDLAAGDIMQPASEGGTLLISGSDVSVGLYGNSTKGTVTLCPSHMSYCTSGFGYDFDTQIMTDNITASQCFFRGTALHINGGQGTKQLADNCDINTTSIPSSGYSIEDSFTLISNECWAVDYGARGKVLIKVLNALGTNPATLQFVYQK